jgi:histidine triad (HIT) family protein
MKSPARAPAPSFNRPGCIFCQILLGEAPAEVVARSDRALAFLTIGPLAEGHTVVIPRTHAADLTEVSVQDTLAVWALVHDVERRLRTARLAEGVDVVCFSGSAAEQAVFHLHLHVVPRRPHDGLALNRWWESQVRPVTSERQAELARRIRAAGAPVG